MDEKVNKFYQILLKKYSLSIGNELEFLHEPAMHMNEHEEEFEEERMVESVESEMNRILD